MVKVHKTEDITRNSHGCWTRVIVRYFFGMSTGTCWSPSCTTGRASDRKLPDAATSKLPFAQQERMTSAELCYMAELDGVTVHHKCLHIFDYGWLWEARQAGRFKGFWSFQRLDLLDLIGLIAETVWPTRKHLSWLGRKPFEIFQNHTVALVWGFWPSMLEPWA